MKRERKTGKEKEMKCERKEKRDGGREEERDNDRNREEKKREEKRKKQVAQGQYVVSDTRCPALSDCELE